MNNKHRKVLDELFKIPTVATLKWRDVEMLFKSLGAKITKGAVEAARRFLTEAGVTYDQI